MKHRYCYLYHPDCTQMTYVGQKVLKHIDVVVKVNVQLAVVGALDANQLSRLQCPCPPAPPIACIHHPIPESIHGNQSEKGSNDTQPYYLNMYYSVSCNINICSKRLPRLGFKQ